MVRATVERIGYTKQEINFGPVKVRVVTSIRPIRPMRRRFRALAARLFARWFTIKAE